MQGNPRGPATMPRRSLILLLLLAGCGSRGLASTRTSSSTLPTLGARVDFLERYVTFRRNYESLDFRVDFFNGGGGLSPSPSEWDIRLVARVPASELQAWVPSGVPPVATADRAWLDAVPTSAELGGISEWYVEKRRVVGIDRKQALVVYRSWAD